MTFFFLYGFRYLTVRLYECYNLPRFKLTIYWDGIINFISFLIFNHIPFSNFYGDIFWLKNVNTKELKKI